MAFSQRKNAAHKRHGGLELSGVDERTVVPILSSSPPAGLVPGDEKAREGFAPRDANVRVCRVEMFGGGGGRKRGGLLQPRRDGYQRKPLSSACPMLGAYVMRKNLFISP